jgi:hypothetical protein
MSSGGIKYLSGTGNPGTGQRARAGKAKPPRKQGLLNDGARGTRTPDLLGAIQALSQLSYSPERRRMPHGCGTV